MKRSVNIEIKTPTYKNIGYLFLGIIFVITGIILFVTATSWQESILSIFGILFFGLIIPLSIKFLIQRKPILILKNNGIYINFSAMSIIENKNKDVFLEWNEIKEIGKYEHRLKTPVADNQIFYLGITLFNQEASVSQAVDKEGRPIHYVIHSSSLPSFKKVKKILSDYPVKFNDDLRRIININ